MPPPTTPVPVAPVRSTPVVRGVRLTTTSLLTVLLTVGLTVVPAVAPTTTGPNAGTASTAVADDLDDRQAALGRQSQEVGEQLDHLDAGIARSVAALRAHQQQLPGARKALADAQQRVSAAAANVQTQAARLTVAEQSKADLDAQVKRDRLAAEGTRRTIGAIAAQAYKNGGVPTSVSLLMDAGSTDDVTGSLRLADAALRSQSVALNSLTQRRATEQNAQARLGAVQQEIGRLKAQADAALTAETSARDEAATSKARVDGLVADSATLTRRLQAQRPAISAQLARVEADQARVRNEIAERQRAELEAARQQASAQAAARAAAAAAARRSAAAAAAAASRPLPPAAVEAPAPATRRADGALHFTHPVPADVPVTSPYGMRTVPKGTIDFTGTGSYLHSGQDFGAACGTPLLAPADGTVMFADKAIPTGGNRIVLSHGVIDGDAVSTIYYHLTSSSVTPGQRVRRGQVIGATGTTGNSTGCHLHFEVMINGSLVDPAPYL